MSCIVCCTSITELGCFSQCDLINTGLTASVSGNYEFHFEISGALRRIAIPFVIGDPIRISAEYFNEDATTKFKVFNPSGNLIGANCYRVTIQPTFSVNGTINQNECNDMFEFNTIVGQVAYTLGVNARGATLSQFTRYVVTVGFQVIPEFDQSAPTPFLNWVVVGNTLTFTDAPTQVLEVKIQGYL